MTAVTFHFSRGLLAQYCSGLLNFVEDRVKGKKRE